jgi:transposase
MQSVPNFFMGVDISKLWVDLTLLKVVDHQKHPLTSARFDNTAAGMEALHHWLEQQQVRFDEHSLMVVENTGVYHRRLWEYCTRTGLPLHIGNAAAIKWSLGLCRGKSDSIDSRRLCAYGYKNREELKPTAWHNPAVLRLKDLLRARNRLQAQANSIRVYLRELAHSSCAEGQALLAEAHQAALSGIKASVQALEQQIRAVIKSTEELRGNYELLISVPGIGHLTAVYLLCCTHNFVWRPTGKQLACYAGVVPFGHSSGTSVRAKDRVHKMANKELKRLLHLGALSAIRNHREFKDYYQRKCAQGKHPISVLNALRNKIALRAAAVIIKQKPYINHCATSAPLS